MSATNTFITVPEIREVLSVSESKAYRIVRTLNEELKQKGYMVIPGRVSRHYFNERFYGINVVGRRELIMPAYKDDKKGTWYVSFHYFDWTGKNVRKMKRGFATKKDAQGYELDITERRLHHEIYLSDARKVAPEKLKTVIRHPIKAKGIAHGIDERVSGFCFRAAVGD